MNDIILLHLSTSSSTIAGIFTQVLLARDFIDVTPRARMDDLT